MRADLLPAAARRATSQTSLAKGLRASRSRGYSACSTTRSASHSTRRVSTSALKTRPPATVSPFSLLATSRSRASLTRAGRFSRGLRASRPATATTLRRRYKRRRRHLKCQRPATRPQGHNNKLNKLNKPEVAPCLHLQSATLVGAIRAGQARARRTAVPAVHRSRRAESDVLFPIGALLSVPSCLL